jgi:hypothetical protein
VKGNTVTFMGDDGELFVTAILKDRRLATEMGLTFVKQ